MKRAITLITIMVFAFGSGCSPKITQTREKVTPSSYDNFTGRVNRSVGLLRRLVVLPPQCIFIQNLQRNRFPEREIMQSTLMLEVATTFLRDWKGYEIIQYEVRNNGEAGTPEAQSRPDPGLKLIYDWADNSEVDSSPPAEVKRVVSDIGRRFEADGVLVLQGFQRIPNTLTLLSVILTASLTWPLLFIEGKAEIKAHIFEAASGRLVWRSRLRPYDAVHRQEIERLLGSLENAAPAALIDRSASID